MRIPFKIGDSVILMSVPHGGVVFDIYEGTIIHIDSLAVYVKVTQTLPGGPGEFGATYIAPDKRGELYWMYNYNTPNVRLAEPKMAPTDDYFSQRHSRKAVT